MFPINIDVKIDNLTPASLKYYLFKIFNINNKIQQSIIEVLLEKEAFQNKVEAWKKEQLDVHVFATYLDFKGGYSQKRVMIKKLIEMGLIGEDYITVKYHTQDAIKTKVVKIFYFKFNDFYEMWNYVENMINRSVERYRNYFKEISKYYR